MIIDFIIEDLMLNSYLQKNLDLLTNERKMAFCMVYLLYQLQEVIFYDGKTKRTNPDGNP